jgi:hypothetical protein
MVGIKNKVDLWDLRYSKIYVKLHRGFLKNLFNYAIRKVGNQNKLAKLLGKNDSTVYNYYHRNEFISLDIVSKILEILPWKERSKWEHLVEKNLEEIKCKGNMSKSLKNPKFPVNFTPSLAGVLGHIIGDGYVEMNKGTPLIGYTNKCTTLIDEFKMSIKEVFGHTTPYERILNYDVHNVRYSAIIGCILSNLIGQLPDSLTQMLLMISQLDEECKSSFLRALFDDEGCVTINKYQVIIEMTNRKVIEVIKTLLLDFEIESGKTSERINEDRLPKYKLAVSGKENLTRFDKIIGFSHPIKREKLRLLLNGYKINYTKFDKIRTLIVNELGISTTLSCNEIAKKINKSLGWTRKILQKLEKENVIKSFKNMNVKIYYLI